MKLKHVLFVDFETYYDNEYSLRRMSPPEYILDSRYQTLMMAAYDLTWDAPRIIMPEHIPGFLYLYPPEQTLCCSHNALFDLAILAWRYNWVAGRLADTLGMVRALRSYKKNSLGEVARQLFGADTKGDVIHKVRGMDAQAIKRAGLWGDFQTYAMQDVRLCAQIYLRLAPEFPPEERRVMDLVLRAAVTPVLHVDRDMLQAHLNDVRKEKYRLLQESGYDKAALMSTVQFKAALENLGVEIEYKPSPAVPDKRLPAFSKTDPFMHGLLEHPDHRVQTLAMARLSHKSTIEETRCQRFLNIAMLPWNNGGSMLPVPLRYGGALTHRLSGEWKMNMQNLPRDKTRSKLREALVAPAGFKMVTADLAQIEARIVAKLCDQGGLVEQFRNGDDIYAQFASIVFHRTITKGKNPNERFLGKTAILGLGYGCGEERYYQMVTTLAQGADIDLEGIFSKRIAKSTVDTYRHLFSNIPRAWRRLDNYLLKFVLSDINTQFTRWGPLKFSSRRVELPNGMFLRYEAVDSQHMYGAKLLENIVQALARIVVMSAAVRLDRRGYRFVMQAHDELVFVMMDSEVEESKRVISQEMTREPDWMPGLPLAVEIKSGQDYGSCK